MDAMPGVGWICRKIQGWLTKINTVVMSKEQVAVEIENFLDGKGGPYDWDDFMSITLADPDLDQVRVICGMLPDRYPPGNEGGYCSEEGFEVMRNLVKELRQEDPD